MIIREACSLHGGPMCLMTPVAIPILSMGLLYFLCLWSVFLVRPCHARVRMPFLCTWMAEV